MSEVSTTVVTFFLERTLAYVEVEPGQTLGVGDVQHGRHDEREERGDLVGYRLENPKHDHHGDDVDALDRLDQRKSGKILQATFIS